MRKHIHFRADTLIPQETESLRRLVSKAKPETVCSAVCEHYKIPRKLLFRRTRKQPLCKARQVTLYILSIDRHKTLQDIADYTKEFDHSTVIHAIKTITNEMHYNKLFRKELNAILSQIVCMSKKIQLVGPYSDLPEHEARGAFNNAEAQAASYGYVVINPVSIVPAGAEYNRAMRICTDSIYDHASAIALLPGWMTSKGARAEKALAECLGLEIITL